jgi:hypothetical protein
MDQLVVRDNFINGHGNNRYHSGSVFILEVGGGSYHTKDGDYIYHGPTYEGNMIANVTSGFPFILGKGGVRMTDITLRNNIVKTNLGPSAIRLASPQKNLLVEHNIFYEQKSVFGSANKEGAMKTPNLPSTITVKNNVIAKCESFIPKKLKDLPEGSTLLVEDNVFDCQKVMFGHGISTPGTIFRNPQDMDFTMLSADNDEDEMKKGYPDSAGGYWKKLADRSPEALPVGEGL